MLASTDELTSGGGGAGGGAAAERAQLETMRRPLSLSTETEVLDQSLLAALRPWPARFSSPLPHALPTLPRSLTRSAPRLTRSSPT